VSSSHLAGNLLVFGRLLRRAGIEVHVGRLLDVAEALTHVDLGSRDEVFHACRALLVHRHEQYAAFERVFAAFWSAHPGMLAADNSHDGVDAPDRPPAPDAGPAPGLVAEASPGEPDEQAVGIVRTWSDAERLARRHFGTFTEDELGEAQDALARLRWTPGTRRTRRWVRGRGPRVDLRRAFAQSLRTRGEIVTLPTRRRLDRPRRLILLCDVSGSMERYARLLIHFAHALGRRHDRLEAFLFSTGLTRVTTALHHRRADQAAAIIAAAVPDWSGGTRIGEVLAQFHRRWARRVLHGGPVVLLVSDGWDRGDPDELRAQVARLQRICHRLIWLNPLIGTPDYAPLTRGLQAALPYVDDFLPCGTLADLGDLAVHLNRIAPGTRRDNPRSSAA